MPNTPLPQAGAPLPTSGATHLEDGAASPKEWQAGAHVGRYVLVTPIAKGGMAEIWLARQPGMKGFEKVVAIKRMISTLEGDADSQEQFLSEARMAALLSHQNIVQVYELGQHEGSYFIAMEYLDGENLSTTRRQALAKGTPLPDPLVARLMSWAAEGLHYAHARTGTDGRNLGIVHRDISPQNLIVTYEGGLKVVDFGIAKAASEATLSGKLKGKLAYMSPEQSHMKPADARSDVFALGVVFFELLAHGRLLPNLNDLETLAYMSSDAPMPSLSARRPDIDADLEGIVARAIARDPRDRYQSGRELQMAIDAWLSNKNHAASSQQVAEFMQTLFAERIRERRRIIESALSSELSPTTVQQLSKLVQADPITGSSKALTLDKVAAGVTPPPKRLPIVVALVAVAAIGVGGWFFSRPAPAPAPAEPTPAVVPVVAKPKPSLRIVSDPPGCELKLDGVAKGVTPALVEELARGEHLLECASPGRVPVKRTVELDDGEKQVMLSLEAVPVAPEAKEPEAKPAAAPKAATKAAPTRTGKLTLKTDPWTSVSLGKKKLGDTPLIGVELPVGRHVLTLSNPESNIQSSVEVEIKADETTVTKLRL